MNITKKQLEGWYSRKSGKEDAIGNHEELLAFRERWLLSFNKREEDIYTDDAGEHIFVEVEETNPNEDTAYTLTRQPLPETIQSRNINL